MTAVLLHKVKLERIIGVNQRGEQYDFVASIVRIGEGEDAKYYDVTFASNEWDALLQRFERGVFSGLKDSDKLVLHCQGVVKTQKYPIKNFGGRVKEGRVYGAQAVGIMRDGIVLERIVDELNHGEIPFPRLADIIVRDKRQKPENRAVLCPSLKLERVQGLSRLGKDVDFIASFAVITRNGKEKYYDVTFSPSVWDAMHDRYCGREPCPKMDDLILLNYSHVKPENPRKIKGGRGEEKEGRLCGVTVAGWEPARDVKLSTNRTDLPRSNEIQVRTLPGPDVSYGADSSCEDIEWAIRNRPSGVYMSFDDNDVYWDEVGPECNWPD